MDRRLWRLVPEVLHYSPFTNLGNITAKVAALTKALDDETIDPNKANKAGRTVIFFAKVTAPQNLEVLDTLINHPRVNVGHQDAEGLTVLHVAAEGGCDGVVEKLLQWHDARKKLVDVGDKTERTPLSWAAEKGHTEVIRQIVTRYPHSRHQPDSDGRVPLSYSAQKGHTKAVSLLIQNAHESVGAADDDDRTPLSFAAGAAPPRNVLGSENASAPVSFAGGAAPWPQPLNLHGSGNRSTPFSSAGVAPWPPPPNLIGSENRSTTEVIELLNDARPDLINFPDRGGETPLWWAVKNENTVAVESLLHLQPTLKVLEERGPNNVPLLHLALQSQNTSIYSSLLNRVPPPRAHNIVGLLGREALVNFVHYLRSHPFRVVGPLAEGDPLEERDKNGRTALHEAVRVNSATMLSALLDLQADINATDISGRTPLHEAAALGAVGPLETLLEPGHNADIDARDSFGKTPLRLALKKGHTSVINTLLGCSAALEGITSKHWRDSHRGLQSFNNFIELLEASEVVSEGMKHIRRTQGLVPKQALLDGLPNEGEKKLFFSLDRNEPWTTILRRIVFDERDRRSLDRVRRDAEDRYFYYGTQERAFMTRVIVSARLPQKNTTEDNSLDREPYNWRVCEAVWEIGTRRDSNAPGIQFFSMLLHGGIPVNEFDFIRLLFDEYKADWLCACAAVEKHLASRRESQLKLKDRDRRGFIDFLAKDARSLALLKRILPEYVDGGRKLVGYSRSHSKRNATRQNIQEALEEAREAINRFSNEVSEKLATLDQTIRDILQLEFAWVSVNEARRSANLAESMKRLSWITFIFLPAIFASSLFGMNVNLLEDNPDWRWYLAFAGGFLILTLVGWIGSKHCPSWGFGGHLKDMAAKVQDTFRAKSSARPDTTNDDRSTGRSIGSV